jgi:hypothetical protein
VLRSGLGSLADVYGGRKNSEAATFFQNHMKVALGKLGDA